MYLEKINGHVYLTVETGLLKKKLKNLANEAFEWLIAGIGAVTLLAVIYYGNIAYQYLTNLF